MSFLFVFVGFFDLFLIPVHKALLLTLNTNCKITSMDGYWGLKDLLSVNCNTKLPQEKI